MDIPDEWRPDRRDLVHRAHPDPPADDNRSSLRPAAHDAGRYIPHGDGFIVIGSKGGVPEPPHWYLNLRENPEVTIEFHGERMRMRAEVAEGEQRERLWADVCERYPMFIDYQAQVTRRLPVIILHRQDDTAASLDSMAAD